MSVIAHVNPETLHKNPAYSQAVTVNAGAKLIYVGGQNGVTKDGKIAGKDIASQSEQAVKNVITALEAAGATMKNVVKMTIYIVQGQSLQDAFAASQKLLQTNTEPPAVSVLFVAGLASPDFLIEIDAVAAIESQSSQKPTMPKTNGRRTNSTV